MPYKHGVYASEIATSISPAAASDSALPFVVGTSAQASDCVPRVVSSWDQYVTTFGYDTEHAAGFHEYSLDSFAYFWFKIMGRGRAIMCSVPAATTDNLIDGINAIDSVYSRFGIVPTLLLCPFYNVVSAVRPVMISKAESFGGKWDCLALLDAPSHVVQTTDATPVVVNAIADSSDLAAWKTFSSGHAAAFWPCAGLGDLRFDLSTVCAAVMARTDAQNGDYPYVSPSNKQAGIDGVYVNSTVDAATETPVFMTEQEVNDDMNAHGIVGAINSAAGWVIWGNNTTIYPTSTDVKDSQIPIRRMFSFVKNMFLQFCAGRVDLPLNKRQLDGIINSFNQQLQGLKGMGAVNSASVALADTNTSLSLLDGIVYIHILISPPPPMRVIEGIVEYDVTGFIESLA